MIEKDIEQHKKSTDKISGPDLYERIEGIVMDDPNISYSEIMKVLASEFNILPYELKKFKCREVFEAAKKTYRIAGRVFKRMI